MLPSELESFMEIWGEDHANVFKYSRPLVPNEYVVIRKNGKAFTSVTGESTYLLKTMDEELMRKMLSTDELVYKCWWYSGLVVRDFKTDSCCCGAWILSDGHNQHSRECPKYDKPLSTSKMWRD